MVRWCAEWRVLHVRPCYCQVRGPWSSISCVGCERWGGLIPLQWRRSTHPCRVPGEFQRELLWLILNFRTMLNRHFLVGILFFVVVILIFCISLKCFVCMMVFTILSIMLPCTVRSLAFFPLKNARASFVKVLVEIRLNVVVQVLNAHPSVVYYGTVL